MSWLIKMELASTHQAIHGSVLTFYERTGQFVSEERPHLAAQDILDFFKGQALSNSSPKRRDCLLDRRQRQLVASLGQQGAEAEFQGLGVLGLTCPRSRRS